jgi:predicted small lipoprotein YifL
VLQSPGFGFAGFPARGALVVALAAALALAGCGRRPGGLDAPPLAAAGDAQPQGGQSGAAPAAAVGPDGKPLAPSAPKQRTWLDWLID